MDGLDDAKADAARGWPVFPCIGKKPATPHGVKDASLDIEKINAWFGNGQTHNVAIATGAASGLLVLDVDPRHGGDVSLEALIDEHGDLPVTVQCETGGGGQHYYFLLPESVEIKNSANVLGPGLDIRSTGGYVIAPPSIHPDTGRPYAWEWSGDPEEVEVAPLPGWLLDRLREAQTRERVTPGTQTPDAAKGVLESACAAIRGASFGQQEEALNTQCLKVGRAVAKGTYRFDFALAHLCRVGRDMANEPGKTPWKPGEIDKKIVRGLSDGIANTRGGSVDRGDVDELPPITNFSAARWDDEEPAPPVFTIEDLAPTGCLVNFAGLAGTGKSILLQTAATCLAVGLPFLGKKTATGAAAYFGFEDPDGVLLHRQARINELLGIAHPEDLFIKSYLGHDLTLFEDGKFTDRLPWLLAQIDAIDGLAAVFLDPGSDVYVDNFYDPVLVKRFCRVLTIEAFKRGITIFLGLHTAKGGEGNKTPFGSMQWLGATRATLVLDHVIGEDGKPTHEEAVLRVHKGNYMRPGDEIELVWQDGLLVPKDAPGGQDQLARLAELDTLIERLVTEAWDMSAPLSDNRRQGERYLPAKIRQASKGRFSHKEAKQQMEDHMRLGRLVITRCPGSRRIGLKVAEPGGHNNCKLGGHCGS